MLARFLTSPLTNSEPIALALHLPFPRRELKRGAGENLPLRRSNAALEHGVLRLDIEVCYVAI